MNKAYKRSERWVEYFMISCLSRKWMRRQICIGLIVSIYVNKLHVHVLSIFSYPKESKKAKYMTWTVIFQGQILNIIKGLSTVSFLLEFIQFTSSLPGLLSMAYISIVVFNLFLTWSGYNRCRSLSKVDSDKVIANDSKNTVTLIIHRH